MTPGEDKRGAPSRRNKPGAYFGIPMPIWVVVFLAGGLVVGVVFPGNRVATAIYTSGTLFPKAVVTFATLVIFALLSGATAKLVMFHRQGAGRLFGLILAAYVALGLASLVYVTLWIPILAKLPLAVPGVAVLGFGAWLRQVGKSFSTLLTDQPLLQVLVCAVVTGYAAATMRGLHSVAQGLIWASETTLWLFKKLLWYYPLMIGCLAIGIPMKFGVKGMTAYGRVTLWVGLVTVSWSIILASLVKVTTKRSFKQLFSYYANVWPTGFGTGGSYETLAMNVVSAEHDLGLRREVAEISIVFGTVMNKSCATMCVMLVTIIVGRLLNIPIGLAEILMLIPPVLVLGLESPGIPGGAAFFMSPIVAVLLQVRDVDVFVATFVTMYSGLIPMFSTAGNTTNDGLVGAWINDRFANYLRLTENPLPRPQASVSLVNEGESLRPRKLAGWILMAPAIWMLVSPQAVLGLSQLKWMYRYAFRGEAVIGVFVMSVALYLLGAQSTPKGAGLLRPESLPRPRSSDTTTDLT
jgi:Na+/H+-dicarboxylate symporter